MSSNLEDSIISLPSASSFSINDVSRESQEDLTLTSLEDSLEEDEPVEEGDNTNTTVTLTDASTFGDLVSTERNDKSILSLSDVSCITLPECGDDHDQQDSDQNLMVSTTLSTTLDCSNNQKERFEPLKQSTPQKSINTTIRPTEITGSTDGTLPDSSRISDLTWSLSVTINMKGCAEQCLKTVHELNEYTLLCAHAQFQAKTTSEQNAWLIQYFECHCPLVGECGEKNVKGISFVIQGRHVCLPGWLQVLGISQSRFYRIRDEFKLNGGIKYLHKSQQNNNHRPKTLQAISWMDQYFKRIGDKRPDSDHDGIYLPTCLTEMKIYEIMLEELYSGKEGYGICYSKFCSIFREDFKNVTIPKHCRFTKCDYCTLLKSEMFKPSITKEEKRSLQELKDEHLALQEQERARYYTNRQLAINNPDEYVSMIVDGMDQNKTNLPSLVRTTKSCQNLWTLRTHLTGVIAHGSGSHFYFDFLQWPHDCNITLFAVLKTLEEISHFRTIPPKLMIQMDNCARENKNKYVFAFFSLLVELDIFAEIELGFLMVGHTHEDIDQNFSCLSRYLKKNSAVTLEDMMQAAKASNHSVTNVSCMDYIFNIRDWLLPHLEPIRYHTEPHIFLFKKNSANKAAMYYKAWSHCDWEPSNEGLVLLKSLPSGKPSLVKPSLNKQDISQMKKDLPKYEATGLFPAGAKEKWEELLENFDARYGQEPSNPVWQLDMFQKVSERCRCAAVPAVSDKVLQHSHAVKEIRKIEVGKKSSRRCPTTPTPSKRICESSSSASAPIPVVGSFIAVCCEKYKDFTPQIGRVKSFDESSVILEWLDGTYTSTWIFWKYRNKIITETLPLRAVLHSPISFTKAMRLKATDITILKQKYVYAEYV